MQRKVEQENKMGVLPINRLLVSMSVPMAISMLVQALYNIVDSIYVSQIASATENAAFTAVSLAFPVQQLMVAIATGTAVGVNALLSRSLGEQNQKNANRAAMNGIFLALLSAIVFFLFGVFGSNLFFSMQSGVQEIVDFGTDYLSVCCIFSFGMFGGVMFDRILQSTGKTIYAMINMLVGAVINIVLDPILIFGWFGFEPMGTRGAAIATVVGQIVAMCLSIYFNFRKNDDVQLSLRGFRPHGRSIRTIYAVGLPSIIMISISSVMVYGLNQIIAALSPYAVAVFGAYFKLQSFIFMPVFGLNNGMIPIVAYNYGARRPERITKAVKLCVLYACCSMAVGLLVFQFLPREILSLFELSQAALDTGVPALRTISLSFVFAGVCIVVGSMFQALGNGVYSLLVSIARQLLVLLPVAWLLSRTGNLELVWLAFPIAEVVSISVTLYFARRIYRLKVRPLYQPA